MRKPTIIVLLALAVAGCTQSQSVGFTGIGGEPTGAQGAGFGSGGVTSGLGFAGYATEPEGGTRRLARSLRGVYGAPEVERFRTDLAGETVLLRRVDLSGAPYIILTGPSGAGGVSALAEQTFRVNALSLTNCRQAGPFLSDPVRGSAAPLAC